MSSIEIPDSDEEEGGCFEEEHFELDPTFKEERSVTPKPTETESNFVNTNSNERTPKKGTDTASSVATTSPNSSEATTASPTTANGTDSTDKPARHRARKTQHQPRPTDTDIQFETIASVNDSGTETSVEPGPTPAKQSKLQQEDTAARNQMRMAIAEMLNEKEMQSKINKIAKERVRCNFLLATYQLPDMNFTLNTTINTLKIQFQERLKQRREKARLAAAARGLPVKKTIVKAKLPQL